MQVNKCRFFVVGIGLLRPQRSPQQATERSGIIAAIYKLLQIINKAWHNYANLHLKSYKLALCKDTKILN